VQLHLVHRGQRPWVGKVRLRSRQIFAARWGAGFSDSSDPPRWCGRRFRCAPRDSFVPARIDGGRMDGDLVEVEISSQRRGGHPKGSYQRPCNDEDRPVSRKRSCTQPMPPAEGEPASHSQAPSWYLDGVPFQRTLVRRSAMSGIAPLEDDDKVCRRKSFAFPPTMGRWRRGASNRLDDWSSTKPSIDTLTDHAANNALPASSPARRLGRGKRKRADEVR